MDRTPVVNHQWLMTLGFCIACFIINKEYKLFPWIFSYCLNVSLNTCTQALTSQNKHTNLTKNTIKPHPYHTTQFTTNTTIILVILISNVATINNTQHAKTPTSLNNTLPHSHTKTNPNFITTSLIISSHLHHPHTHTHINYMHHKLKTNTLGQVYFFTQSNNTSLT